jgi:hypothetical protein
MIFAAANAPPANAPRRNALLQVGPVAPAAPAMAPRPLKTRRSAASRELERAMFAPCEETNNNSNNTTPERARLLRVLAARKEAAVAAAAVAQAAAEAKRQANKAKKAAAKKLAAKNKVAEEPAAFDYYECSNEDNDGGDDGGDDDDAAPLFSSSSSSSSSLFADARDDAFAVDADAEGNEAAAELLDALFPPVVAKRASAALPSEPVVDPVAAATARADAELFERLDAMPPLPLPAPAPSSPLRLPAPARAGGGRPRLRLRRHSSRRVWWAPELGTLAEEEQRAPPDAAGLLPPLRPSEPDGDGGGGSGSGDEVDGVVRVFDAAASSSSSNKSKDEGGGGLASPHPPTPPPPTTTTTKTTKTTTTDEDDGDGEGDGGDVDDGGGGGGGGDKDAALLERVREMEQELREVRAATAALRRAEALFVGAGLACVLWAAGATAVAVPCFWMVWRRAGAAPRAPPSASVCRCD